LCRWTISNTWQREGLNKSHAPPPPDPVRLTMRVIEPDYYRLKRFARGRGDSSTEEGKMELEEETRPQTVKIWAHTPPRTIEDGGIITKANWISFAINDLVQALFKSIEGVKLKSIDGSSSIDSGEAFHEIITGEKGANDYVQADLTKRPRKDPVLNVLLELETTKSWKATVASSDVIANTKKLYWNVIESDFDTPEIVSIGFLVRKTRKLINPEAKLKELKEILSKAGKPSNIELGTKKSIAHKNPDTAKTMRVEDLVEVICEKQHRKEIEEGLKGQLIAYSEANSDLPAYEKKLVDHIEFIQQIATVSWAGITARVLESPIQNSPHTVLGVLLNQQAKGKPIFKSVEATKFVDKGIFLIYYRKDLEDEARSYLTKEFRAVYEQATAFNEHKHPTADEMFGPISQVKKPGGMLLHIPAGATTSGKPEPLPPLRYARPTKQPPASNFWKDSKRNPHLRQHKSDDTTQATNMTASSTQVGEAPSTEAVQAMITSTINASKQQEHQQLAFLLQQEFKKQKDDISREFEQRMDRYKAETEQRITEQLDALRTELKEEMKKERGKLVSKVKEKLAEQRKDAKASFVAFEENLDSMWDAIQEHHTEMEEATGITERKRQHDEATKDHAAIAEAAKYDYSSHYMEQSDLLQLTQDQSTIVMNATFAHDDDEHEIEFEAKRTNNKTMDEEL
jgi:hypothetical protein